MKTCVLKNGATVPEVLVSPTMIALEGLLSANPVAFYELTELARDETHELFGNTGEVLESFGLIQRRNAVLGKIHDAVRDIVISATENGQFGSPLKEPVR
jgi:hypothetical protein